LEAFRERCVTKISGGEFQKALIGRALAQNTPVLLLDEPINHLDVKNQMEIMDIIVNLARERRLITLIVLHDLNLALHYADRPLLLDQGQTVFCGPTGDLSSEDLSAAYQTGIDIRASLKIGA